MPREQLHHRIRDALRVAPCNASAVAVQTKVSRDQLAALLLGSPDVSDETLSRVTARLGLTIQGERPERPPYVPGPVETVVDRALRGCY